MPHQSAGSNIKKASEARREELLRAIADVHIPINCLPFDQLIDRAIVHYNARARPHADFASRSSDPDFLARIASNYARHCLTDYDAILAVLMGRVGKETAYWVLRTRVMEAIYDAYPELAALEARAGA